MALLRIAGIYEEKLGEPEKALEAYRKLTTWKHQRKARKHIQAMTIKGLRLMTKRVFTINPTGKSYDFLPH